jgi:hypothetical protein
MRGAAEIRQVFREEPLHFQPRQGACRSRFLAAQRLLSEELAVVFIDTLLQVP